MAFDPTKPVDHAQVVAAELRGQFTALKALLDGLEARVALLEGPVPLAPVGMSFTQLNPGDAVAGDGTPQAGVTLARAYVRAVGDPAAPVLVATSATLPLSFTIAPGDYEFTLTYENAHGEGPPSAPVVLTVV